MVVHRGVPVSVLFAIPFLVTVAATPAYSDAGSGADAGDAPGDATPLDGPGLYTGAIRPSDDPDWYSLSTAGTDALCVEARIEGDLHANVTLGNADLTRAATRRLTSLVGVDLGIASPSLAGALLGITPTDGWSAKEHSDAGGYAFAIDLVGVDDLGPGDAGTPTDAGSDLDSSLPVPSPCFGGRLDTLRMDRTDVFSFAGEAGEPVTLTFALPASAPVSLTLQGPSGVGLATITSGGIVDIVLPESGTYGLTVRFTNVTMTTSTAYIIGLSDGPEPPPCRPHCLNWLLE